MQYNPQSNTRVIHAETVDLVGPHNSKMCFFDRKLCVLYFASNYGMDTFMRQEHSTKISKITVTFFDTCSGTTELYALYTSAKKFMRNNTTEVIHRDHSGNVVKTTISGIDLGRSLFEQITGIDLVGSLFGHNSDTWQSSEQIIERIGSDSRLSSEQIIETEEIFQVEGTERSHFGTEQNYVVGIVTSIIYNA